MRFLLDTHALLWLLYSPEKLGSETTKKITLADEVLASTVSLWEIAIKHSSGKLEYAPDRVIENLDKAGLVELYILHPHIRTYQSVVTDHNDPFDRLLVAQAVSENLLLVTADKSLLDSRYKTIDART